MCEQSLCKVWILRNENCWSYRLHKPDTIYAFLDWKMSNFITPKKWENINQMCTKREVHIFNVWTIIMQSLNIKQWKLLELQITQTRQHLSILDGICLTSSPLKKENIHVMSTKYKLHIFNMWTIITQSLNKKEWKLLELKITQTMYPKSVADGRMDGLDLLLELLLLKRWRYKLNTVSTSCTSCGKKTLFLLHEKSKGVDQLARMCKLVYTFVIGLCYSPHPLPCGLERYWDKVPNCFPYLFYLNL